MEAGEVRWASGLEGVGCEEGECAEGAAEGEWDECEAEPGVGADGGRGIDGAGCA
jgi:hypothetical protein